MVAPYALPGISGHIHHRQPSSHFFGPSFTLGGVVRWPFGKLHFASMIHKNVVASDLNSVLREDLLQISLYAGSQLQFNFRHHVMQPQVTITSLGAAFLF